VDDKEAATGPQDPAMPASEETGIRTPTEATGTAGEPAAGGAREPSPAKTSDTGSASLPPTRVHKRRFPKFDKLWESVKRWTGDDPSGVIPAGAVHRTRHRQPRVFFVDTGNASSSQMAEAFALQEDLHAESGGTFPSGDIPHEAIEAMDEKGIDLRACRPKLIDPTRLHSFDRVVLLGGMFPPAWREGARVEEWEILNPAGLPLEGYRLVRDDVEKRVKRLAKILHGKQAQKDAAASKMLKAR
jgi:arsenate reductase (thioredoxin)